MEHFARSGYTTTAISGRKPFDTYGANFLSVDLTNRAACEAAFGNIRDCTRIVFAAVDDQQAIQSHPPARSPQYAPGGTQNNLEKSPKHGPASGALQFRTAIKLTAAVVALSLRQTGDNRPR